MRITEAEQAQRKYRMIHAAYALFCEYGIDAVTVAQIAKASQVSPQSIFRYFQSKAHLLQYAQELLWQEIMRQLLADIRDPLANASDGLAEIAVLLNGFKGLYERHSQYLLFACEYKLFLVRHHIILSQKINQDMLRPVSDVFLAALQRGQLDGSISNAVPMDTQFAVMWNVLRGCLEEIVICDRIYDGENTGKETFDLVLHHVLAALRSKTADHTAAKSR